MPKARAKRSGNSELLHEAQARAAAEKLSHDLLDAAPDAILEIDSGGRIVRANATVEELFGFRVDELLNQPVEILVPEEFRPAHVRHRNGYLERPAKRPMGSNLELYARRKDGSRFPADIILSPFYVEDGKTHTAVVVRDATFQKRIEKELKEARDLAEAANRAKSDFLASMSHELRSPLNTIMGYTQLLAEETVGPLNEKQRRFVQHIGKDSEHLLNLINDILDLSKIEAGRIELRRESLNFQSVLNDAISMAQPWAAEKGVQLANEALPDAMVWGDGLRLKQVLVNLLSNAVKFTPAGGSVTVRTAQDGHQVAITVADTGIGIPPEHHEAIFDRFHQVASTTKGVREGTGLGLAIAKTLVEQMGGRIWVESAVGQGSRFTFTLDGRIANVTNKAKVLVVDDELPAAQLIEEYLKPEGYEITLSDSVESAQSALANLRPDVIILDLRMPGKAEGGMDLLKRLNESPETKDIPVVIASVLESEASSTNRLNAAAHLTKPIQKQALLNTLNRLVS
jgi:PAS domain S-box-containing protein